MAMVGACCRVAWRVAVGMRGARDVAGDSVRRSPRLRIRKIPVELYPQKSVEGAVYPHRQAGGVCLIRWCVSHPMRCCLPWHAIGARVWSVEAQVGVGPIRLNKVL